jgi:hypothetical protein
MVILLIFRYYFDLTIDITISVFCLSNMTNYWPTIYLVLWYTQIKWIGNNIDHPNYSVPFAECFSPAVDHIWNRLKDMKSIRNVMAKSFSGWKAPIQSFDSQICRDSASQVACKWTTKAFSQLHFKRSTSFLLDLGCQNVPWHRWHSHFFSNWRYIVGKGSLHSRGTLWNFEFRAFQMFQASTSFGQQHIGRLCINT